MGVSKQLQPTVNYTMVKPRQTSIDYMKGVLVIGMVLAHALQLLSKPRGIFWLFSTTINLITFSGFFFCFGYVFFLSYLTKPFADVNLKMAKTAIKSLFAYYLSGFSAYLLLSPRFLGKPYPITLDEILQLITFNKVAWFSEFLLTFFLITGLVLIFFQGFKQLAHSPIAMLCLGLVCLIIAWLLPTDLIVPQPMALLIGTKNYFIFPVIQYLPIFLIGIYFSNYRVGWSRAVLALSLLGTGLLISYYIWHQAMPAEFLPSVYWLVGSYGILYGYYVAAKWLEHRPNPLNWLLSIGRNTLFYLLVSNFILFALSNHIQTKPEMAFLVGVITLLIITFLFSLLTQSPKTRRETQVSRVPVLQDK
ncbi:hypothetical protein GCM10028774_17440 [Spirosoma jeollabukense]